LKNKYEDLEVEAQQLSLNKCNLEKANEKLREQALQKEAERKKVLQELNNEAKIVLEELEEEKRKNKILLEDKQATEKSIKEKIDRIEELQGHRFDLTEELESLEKKLKEAEDVIDSCKEEEVDKYRKDLVAGKKMEPEIEDQIKHLIKALEIQSNGRITLEKLQIEEKEKKLAAGRNFGEVVMGIEKCEHCKNNLQDKLMEFLNKQRTK